MVTGCMGDLANSCPRGVDGRPFKVVTTDNTFKTFPVKKEQKKEVAAGGESGVKIETRREGGWVSLLVLRWEILGQRAKD